jgi:hypothetical protein
LEEPYTAYAQQNFGNPTTWEWIFIQEFLHLYMAGSPSLKRPTPQFLTSFLFLTLAMGAFLPKETISSEAFPTLNHANMNSEWISYLGF